MSLIDCGNTIEVEMQFESLFFKDAAAFAEWYDDSAADSCDDDSDDEDHDDDLPLGPLPDEVVSEDDALSPKQMDEALMRSGQMTRD